MELAPSLKSPSYVHLNLLIRLWQTKHAMKALFKLKHILYGSLMNPLKRLKVFDKLVKSIALDGSEVWGVVILNISSLQHFFRKYGETYL